MTTSVDNNVVTFLSRAADRTPDRPALIFGGGNAPVGVLTFSQLWRRADAISAGLVAEGIAPGDRVIVMIPMSLELYAVLLGLLKLGAVAVFVDPWIGRKQIAAFAAFAEPRAFIGIAKSHLLRLLDPGLREIPLTVTTGGRLWRWPARRSLREIESETGSGEIHPTSAIDPALITFTTGSSGTPKGANRTHAFLAAQHRALESEFSYDDDDVDMPMFPVFALNNLALGISSVVPEMDFARVADIDPAPVLRQLHTHGVTTCTASPPFFDRLAEHVSRDPGTRPGLRRILTGGAPVADAQLRSWQRVFKGTEIVVVYGSTEAEPVAHIEAAERMRATSDIRPRSPGYCVGRPTTQVKTRVVRVEREGVVAEHPTDVPTHEVGELLVNGDHVCKDYFRNPEAARENKWIDRRGDVWHRMGDTGYFDGQGRFWLVGRVHSTIVRAGEQVHPQLVEQGAGTEDPRIRRAAAVGVPDPRLGERVVLVLESSQSQSQSQSFREEVRTRLAHAGQPVDEIVILDEPLPVDPRHNSKIDYAALRAQVQELARR